MGYRIPGWAIGVLIHVPTARDWLFARMHYPNSRRSEKQRKAQEVVT
jgi:hypothetical protein